MLRGVASLLTSTALLLFAAAPALTARSTPDVAHAFLRSTLAVTDEELARLDAGRVVARTLASSDSREVATFGVVRVAITPAAYVARLADIVKFKNDAAVLQIGTFSDPPVVEDMAALTLDDADARNLRNCHVGHCSLQLSAEAIRQFESGVDWRAPDATRQAEALLRRVLVTYAAGYLKHGGKASMVYADVSPDTDMGREFASLFDPPDPIWKQFHALRHHLLTYPAPGDADMTDRLYWSKELIRSRGVVSITHVSVARLAEDSAADYAVATKQIYGSHYYDASLGLTVLVPDRSSATPLTYVVYLNRSRIDLFNGLFGGIVRGLVKSNARSTVATMLGRMRQSLETPARTP